MPTGTPITWTRDMIELVIEAEGRKEHELLAEWFGCSANTIYSIRKTVEMLGGIDEFFAWRARPRKQRRRTYHRRGPRTLEQQLLSPYVITIGRSGRAGTTVQYSVTIPRTIGEEWVEKHGPLVTFVPTEDGLLIVPYNDERRNDGD